MFGLVATWSGRRKLVALALAGLWWEAAAGVPALGATGGGLTAGWEHGALCRYCQAAADSGAAAADVAGTRQRNYAPDRQVDVVHLKLDVAPDFRTRRVSGTATVAFRPLAQPLKSLRLDGVDLEVRAVRGSHAVAAFSASRDDVTIAFAEPIPADVDAWVEIDYAAQPARGLYFRTPEMGFAAEDEHVWTQGEPHEARHWYPCFDAPNERSSTEIVCRVPADMTVLSNGRLVGEEIDASTGLKRVHWLQSKPHANYLVCLVAGRLHGIEGSHRDVPLRFFTQPTLAEHAENSFADTAAIMAFFEAETGVAFPWDKYDQVTIADFMWGGMENTTLTTLTQRTLFSQATENVYQSRRLDAHELAHQWFGNYVTCKDWSHLWLNEGFATYYTHLYEGHKFGREALLYGLHRDAEGEVLARGDDRRPMVYREYRTPNEQFDYRAYPKGSWVLHMLRSLVGDDLFREAIHVYLQRHALSPVETDDLRETFEEFSGRSLDRFFDQWVYHAGFPELKIRYRWLADQKLAHVSVEQAAPREGRLVFEFETELQFLLAAESAAVGGAAAGGAAAAAPQYEPVVERIRVDQLKHDFYVKLPREPAIVRFDPRYTLLAKIDFEQPDAMLLAQARLASDAMGRVLACEALASRKTDPSVQALQHALDHDPFFGVRETAARSLARQGTDAAVTALLASRQQADARVRLAVVEQLGKFYRQAVREALLETARNEANPAIRAAALRGLGKHADEEVAAALRAALDDRSFRDEPAAAALEAIGQLQLTELRQPILDMLAARSHELTPGTVAAGLSALAKTGQGRRGRDAVYRILAEYLEHPRQQLQIEAARALGELGDRRAIPVLQGLAGEEGYRDRLGQAAQAALEQLERGAAAPPEEVRRLREEVRTLREAQTRYESDLERLERKHAAFEAGEPDQR